jgi:hypothetical protein
LSQDLGPVVAALAALAALADLDDRELAALIATVNDCPQFAPGSDLAYTLRSQERT